MSSDRAQWGSRFGFILAAAGSAIGLGNIWKFPYITGENGGGLFVLIYLVCIALVGLPIMVAEILIGRASQRQPVAAFHALEGRRTAWAGVGWLGLLAGFVILSYYIVVAGWAMDYTLKSVVNYTQPMHRQAAAEAEAFVASASTEEIVGYLAAKKAAHDAREEIGDLRRAVRPSVWTDYERFEAAIAASADREEAGRRLMLDPERARRVALAQEYLSRIAEVEARHLESAQAHFEAMPEVERLAHAEDARRRDAVAVLVGDAFDVTATDGWTSAAWSAVFMLVTILIVAGGISGGIERTCRILMPALFGIIVAMVGYGLFQPGFSEAFAFVFSPDPSKLKPSGVLEALGHAFFTLSLGMGAMITYGSYQRSRSGGLVGESVAIAGLDTLIALLACMMMFPILFSYGQEPDAGPGLVFKSMPIAFSEIGAGGMLLAILFFGLLVFAALTSSISLLEVVASYFIDERGWSRARSAWALGGIVFLCGLPCAFSFDPDFLMSSWNDAFGKSYFDSMDYLASNWMLPLGGLFIALYAGWRMPARLRDAEFDGAAGIALVGWLMLIRFVAPVLVVVVLLQKVGILDVDELLGAGVG